MIQVGATLPEQFRIRSDEDLTRALERLRERGTVASPPAAVSSGSRSAAETRIGWYVPARHRDARLEGCPAPVAGRWCECEGVQHYVPRSASQAAALAAALAWVEAARAGDGPMLLLIGPHGTGKSHLMYAAVRAANLTGVNCGAWGWYDLGLLLRDAKFSRDEEGHVRARYERDRLFGCRAFGIDEIRPTARTEFDATELGQILTRAYRECQAVIATSNFSDRELEGIISTAAHDRFTVVRLSGESYRQAR